MRFVLFIVLALMVLGGGGAGAYFYFSQTAEASAGPESGDDHDLKTKKHAKKGDHGGEPVFVELDPLILPIVDNSGVTQVVSLVIALEVADKDTAKKVEALSPRLKDAFIQDMYGVLNRYAALKDGVVQVSVIKERLNKITHEVLGEDDVSEVLLQVVQQRPI